MRNTERAPSHVGLGEFGPHSIVYSSKMIQKLSLRDLRYYHHHYIDTYSLNYVKIKLLSLPKVNEVASNFFAFLIDDTRNVVISKVKEIQRWWQCHGDHFFEFKRIIVQL